MLWKGGRKSDNVEDLRGSGMGRNVAASAIGDDRLQKQSKAYIVPDSFTHGSSAVSVFIPTRSWPVAYRRCRTPRD